MAYLTTQPALSFWSLGPKFLILLLLLTTSTLTQSLTIGILSICGVVLYVLVKYSTPIASSYITNTTWRIQYGNQTNVHQLNQIECVSFWPSNQGGDRVFIQMKDGNVIPVADAAIPDFNDLRKELCDIGIKTERVCII